MSVRVALVGSGIFVQLSHLPAIKQASNITLKAVYSRSLASAKSLGVDVDLYSDDSGVGKTYHDLLLRDDIDAVIVALPITKQPEYIEAALAAGKHVLSEKPIAADIKRAEQLIQYYKSDKVKGNATWGVAENFRFLDSFIYARQEIEKMGRILGFHTKKFGYVKADDKYYKTSWRSTPDYQGGFLLDGGVHFIAGTRLLLGEEAKPTAISAFTTLLQPHLIPVDTINSTWITKSGISGTYSNSFGTTFSQTEYTIAAEKGTVTVSGPTVTVTEGEQKLGKSSVKEFPDEENGVRQEVAAWAQSILDGRPNPLQSPEEALADLEILEKMLKSGEAKGKVEELQLQI